MNEAQKFGIFTDVKIKKQGIKALFFLCFKIYAKSLKSLVRAFFDIGNIFILLILKMLYRAFNRTFRVYAYLCIYAFFMHCTYCTKKRVGYFTNLYILTNLFFGVAITTTQKHQRYTKSALYFIRNRLYTNYDI